MVGLCEELHKYAVHSLLAYTELYISLRYQQQRICPKDLSNMKMNAGVKVEA